MSSQTESFRFAPDSPDFAKDPYTTYDELRKHEGFYFAEDFNLFLVSKYVDVKNIAENPNLVRVLEGNGEQAIESAQKRRENFHDMPSHEKYIQTSLLDSEGEKHDRLRKVVFRLFTPKAVFERREWIEQRIKKILLTLEAQTFDFVDKVAGQVPGIVIGKLIGVPESDCQSLRKWSEDIVQYFDINNRNEERKALAENTTARFAQYLKGLWAEKQARPGADLISHLVGEESEGRLTEDECISLCMLTLMAGHGSTQDVLGTGLLNLLRNPDQVRTLKEDPKYFSMAIQEMFRIDSPLPFFHRYSNTAIEMNGTTFRKGTKFGLLYGSANRDPDIFSEPDKFNVKRKANRHLAFGAGHHFCLGNHVARLSMETIFTTMLNQFSRVSLCDKDPTYKPGLSARGLSSLRVELGRYQG